MAKVKVKRRGTRIDMTAMCDVAFLLLTFFIMTSTAKLPEPYEVSMPASTVQSKVPDTNLATIAVEENRVYFGVTGREVRKDMLSRMAEKYKMSFTEEEIERFSLIDFFGVDISQVKSLIAMSNTDRMRTGAQHGIPHDSINNQLSDWVLSARYAAAKIDKMDLNIAIKGDASIDYPVIKRVIDILQDQKKNSFYLITSLRSDDF